MSLLSNFKASVRAAFCYGSAAFKQSSYSPTDKPMLDIILIVDHTPSFHAINKMQHPSHYSSITRSISEHGLDRIQRAGAGVFFNPYIHLNNDQVCVPCFRPNF